MKFKYVFALILISMILFSLGTVVASENTNHNSSSDNTYSTIDTVDDQVYVSSADTGHNSAKSSISSADTDSASAKNSVSSSDIVNDTQHSINKDSNDDFPKNIEKDMIQDNPSGASLNDEVDLSIDMELGDTKKYSYGFNNLSFDVPFIITAKVSNGIAKNTKVYQNIPKEFVYLSHTTSFGVYDPETGIWDLGDLDSSFNATLTILTKINTQGTFVVKVNGTTDSNDVLLSNNDLQCNVKVSSRITSNTTRTSADQNGAQHNRHQGSEASSGFVERSNQDNQENEDKSQKINDKDSSTEANSDGNTGSSSEHSDSLSNHRTKSDANTNSKSGHSSSSSNNEINPDSNNDIDSNSDPNLRTNNAKKINLNIFNKATKSLSNAINNILNPDSSSDDDSVNSAVTVKSVDIYDYTQIPILIFGIFLIGLFGIISFDKIKS